MAADSAEHWQQGIYDVWHLAGNCRVRQGATEVCGPEAVVWIDQGAAGQENAPSKVIAYFERGSQQAVQLQHGAASGNAQVDRLETPAWFGRFTTIAEVEIKSPRQQSRPATLPAIVERGLK
ncbi:hypothetical protein, partial [Pseudorhodoplanes sp.]|uniref:hypothetical protein n=1 Tax=Pseudorhodoplanes sp. TaxID=1934341 RepID=UPI003D097632